jgi:hypothetical protein
MRKNLLHSTLLVSCLAMALIACKKDKAAPVIVPTTVKEWMIPLSVKNENTPSFGRTETGTASLKLLSDNLLLLPAQR